MKNNNKGTEDQHSPKCKRKEQKEYRRGWFTLQKINFMKTSYLTDLRNLTGEAQVN
jgi:hypothetical protein